MRIERLDPDALRASLRLGCRYLELNKDILDNLNVFPVPDGDTGVNMVSTLKPAVEELEKAGCASLQDISEVMRAALSRSSRGNSGFILAQFFRGFWEVAAGGSSIEPDTMVKGFERGAFAAVSSLLAPVEGTMITIIASMAHAMKGMDSKSVVGCLEAAVEAGRRELDNTPELLPLLAQAGVVDAGALGFIFIVKGMLCALLGREVVAEQESSFRREPLSGHRSPRAPGSETKDRYCVELEIRTDPARVDSLKELLARLGSSVALMADGGWIRVHIHTSRPDELLERLGGYGEVKESKREDMEEQIAGVRSAARRVAAGPEGAPVLSIIPGPGFRSLFEELGAPDCLEYGDSLPSTEDILRAIGGMSAKEVIVLPNNPNIIPTVQLAADQADAHVHFLRTRSVVEGMTAMYGYSESDAVDANMRSMMDSIGLARTLGVYRASRDATFGQLRIKMEDYFVVDGEDVLSTDHSIESSIVAAFRATDVAEKSHVSFYYADGFDLSRLPEIREGLARLNSALEFEEHYGGQRKGILIIALE